MNKTIAQKGFAVIEILIAISIFAIFSTGIFYLSMDTVDRDSKVVLSAQAALYAQEGLEAVRGMKDSNYLLVTNGDHGLNLNGSEWEFVTAPDTIDGMYDRTITVEDVYRDGGGDIDDSGGTYDPDTKKVTSQVVWQEKGVNEQEIELTTFVTNWRPNDWIETTCAEFDAGTHEDTETESAASPPADNCDLKLIELPLEADVYSTADLGTHANDVVVDGNYAYLAVADVHNGFSVVNVTNKENPVEIADISVWGKGRKITKTGDAIYMGVQSFLQGLSIVDVSDPYNPDRVLNWFLGSWGNEMAVQGDYLYATAEAPWGFLIYDISNRWLPVPVITELVWFDDEVRAVEVSGDYAYVGLDDDNLGFRVADISDPYNASQVASLDVGEEVNAIELSGPLAYIGTEDSSDSLQVINISDPAIPSIVASLDVGGEIQDIGIWNDRLYAAVDQQNAGLAAIDISNPFNPTLLYNLDVTGKGTGIDVDNDYVYISTDTSNKGLAIIDPAMPTVETSGTFTSVIYDTGGEETQYNFLEWDHTEVPGSTIRFQLRTSSSTGNMDSATWVGPDGLPSSYYENSRTAIELHNGRSGQRYCQFKAYLTSDGITTPVIHSIRLNYIP